MHLCCCYRMAQVPVIAKKIIECTHPDAKEAILVHCRSANAGLRFDCCDQCSLILSELAMPSSLSVLLCFLHLTCRARADALVQYLKAENLLPADMDRGIEFILAERASSGALDATRIKDRPQGAGLKK